MLPEGNETEWTAKATIKALERGWKYLGDVVTTVSEQLATCKNEQEAFLLGMWAMNKSMSLKEQAPD